jgi:hypothetical protein
MNPTVEQRMAIFIISFCIGVTEDNKRRCMACQRIGNRTGDIVHKDDCVYLVAMNYLGLL